MKQSLFIMLASILSLASFAQSQYEVSTDANGTKILKGIISRDLVAKDTAFKWYADNQKSYTAPAETITALKTVSPQTQVVIFAGTWCGDTKYLLPRYFSLMESAQFSQDRVTLIGVDRSKKTIGHLTEAFNILNVPTLIVLKDGKEVGRIVEYGKSGQPDKDLVEILSLVK